MPTSVSLWHIVSVAFIVYVYSRSVLLMLQHSRDCGSGTAVFLVVNSSLILIVRGPRAVVWGSVYLDAHSEEDRELRYVE